MTVAVGSTAKTVTLGGNINTSANLTTTGGDLAINTGSGPKNVTLNGNLTLAG